MNTYAERAREKKGQSTSSADFQSPRDGKPASQFVDNRPETAGQRKLQRMANEHSQAVQLGAVQKMTNTNVIQRKYDHLFNDIPKTLSNLPGSLKSGKISEIRARLNVLRDDGSNGVDGLHDGEDKNAVEFGHAQLSFLTAANAYSSSLIDERGMREATFTLWKYSVDSDVAARVRNAPPKVAEWNSLEKQTWDALTKHTGIDE